MNTKGVLCFYAIENMYGVRQLTKDKAELLNEDYELIKTFYAIDGVGGFKGEEDLLSQAQTLALALEDENEELAFIDDDLEEELDFILSENMFGYEA